MNKRDTPSVDENDPASAAVELNPEKIDLQKKPASNEKGLASAPEFPPEQKPIDKAQPT